LPTPAFRWSGGTTTEPEAGDTDTGHQPGGDEALPRDHGPQRGRRVLAAIDTVDATRVLQAADVLAKQLGAAVDAIHVRAAGHRDGLFAGASAERAHVPLRLLTGPTINTIVAETDADEVVACVLGTQSALVEQRPAGHIALGVIERCAKPVLVVPPAAALSAPPHRVLLPLDHRDRFAGWVAVVCSLLPPEAELVPLLVLTPETAPIFDTAQGDQLGEWAAGLVGGGPSRLRNPVIVRSSLTPGAAIAQTAESDGFDLIVLGWAQQLAKGRGQVVHQVLATTTVPVLMLPREWAGISDAPHSQQAQHVVDRWGEPVEILLVENKPAHVRLTQEALDEVGLVNALHVVDSGETALAFLRRQDPYPDAPQPGLILLSVYLPGRTGLNVLAEIKADPKLHDIPVAMLTSSTQGKDVARAYELGAACFITKPVRYAEFVDAVRNLGRFWFTTVTSPPRWPG